MLNKTFEIVLNTKFHESHPTDVFVNQGDTRSVIFNFRIKDGVNEINYNHVSKALLFILRPDKNVIQLTTNARGDGGYTIMLPQQALAAHGRVLGTLALYGHTGERITTLPFYFLIGRDLLGREEVENTVEFDALGRAIALLENAIRMYEQFPRLNVLGRFNTQNELEAAFPNGRNLEGGFFVGNGEEARYFYWSIITDSWENADPWRGAKGEAATIKVGSVTTGSAGSNVIITNSGTPNEAIFDFSIPRGEQGASGINIPLANGFFRFEIEDGYLYIVSHDGGTHGFSIDNEGYLVLDI